MKAITYARYGPPSVLQTQDVPDPQPGVNDILIRVRAAEATKSDCEMRSFKFSVKWFWLPLRIALGIRRPRRQILGGYFSGEIVACGSGVANFSPGQAVFGATGLAMGAYAEYLVLPATSTISPKPSSMSFADAAAVPLGGLNALHFMRLAKIRPGEKVLVLGAGGSIGLHGIQIAKAMGAQVTAVDSTAKEILCRRSGADHYIDYLREDPFQSDGLYDVIFDMVPSGAYADRMRVLAPGGRYLSGNPRLSVMLRSLFTHLFSSRTASFAFARESIAELRELTKLIEEGRIRSIVDRVFPMDQAAEAHRLVETEQRLGAIVIAMDDAIDS
ncbi:NAD(P)-dependent alcohol dehydrogenase [Dokdonella sp.]|uniref:NAD(P)-dependent alcohol dehydrogenase n=1 Tax=Dokdonella sp. TaxID=2291710 RepID=UPI003529969E